mmetsp:Transcript_43402/g.112416  ORF Transcript_43402/g.112416 Transcript_43402/m.112416 type:complete len:465 (-) Transcript_43402:433-1827(-)
MSAAALRRGLSGLARAPRPTAHGGPVALLSTPPLAVPSTCRKVAAHGRRPGGVPISVGRRHATGSSARQPSSPSSAPSAAPSGGVPPKPPPAGDNSGFLTRAAKILPGLALAGAVAQVGAVGAEWLGGAMMAAQGLGDGPSPISAVPVAILLGLGINNLALPVSALPVLQPGLRFCSKAVLQAGIVCVGAKLSAVEVMKLGAAGVPVVAASIAAGLGSVLWLNARLGLPARLGSLTAAGTSICGVTAITALAPAIQANQQEVAYAVANVVAFGLFGMLAYPVAAHHLLDTSEQVGLFLGTAIHDTSQVMGAGLTYAQMYQDETALKVAAVTKLMRNACLAAVIPALTYMHASAGATARTPLTTLFPPFIFGFLAMAGLRSAGDATAGFGQMSEAQWKAATAAVGADASGQLLATAMAAVGLSTSFSVFKGVGLKPFAVGMAGAAVVGLTGFTSALFLGKSIKYE